jgi:hypothetical protein
MVQTCDPGVVIVNQGPGMVRYRAADGKEWTVHGICDQRGWCVVGAIVHGWQVRDIADYRGLFDLLGDRLGFRLDCPVAPSAKGCCEFRFEVAS